MTMPGRPPLTTLGKPYRLAVVARDPGFRRSLAAMLEPHWPGRIAAAARLPARGVLTAGVIAWDAETGRKAAEQARLRRIPVLLLGAPTAALSMADQDDGSSRLDLPVHPERLVTALHAILARRTQTVRQDPADHQPLRFDPVARRLALPDGSAVALTEIEIRLLSELWDAPAPLPRSTLLAAVWGYSDAIATHTLATHIYRLRRKLAKLGASVALVNDAGGYQLLRGTDAPAIDGPAADILPAG